MLLPLPTIILITFFPSSFLVPTSPTTHIFPVLSWWRRDIDVEIEEGEQEKNLISEVGKPHGKGETEGGNGGGGHRP
jgi:hypothetical protein